MRRRLGGRLPLAGCVEPPAFGCAFTIADAEVWVDVGSRTSSSGPGHHDASVELGWPYVPQDGFFLVFTLVAGAARKPARLVRVEQLAGAQVVLVLHAMEGRSCPAEKDDSDAMFSRKLREQQSGFAQMLCSQLKALSIIVLRVLVGIKKVRESVDNDQFHGP